MPDERVFVIPADMAGQTLAAALRRLAPDRSWSQAKRLIAARRVRIDGTLCVNDARRLNEGETLTLLDQPAPPLPSSQDVRILHLDPDLVVLEKPAGVITLRRDEESEFSDQRKRLQPSLDELLVTMLPGAAPRHSGRPGKRHRKPPVVLYPVHRLDRDTSGLMLFALSPRARDPLIEQFSRHAVQRTYIAVVHGNLPSPRRLETWIVRDRGDGLRGSSPKGPDDSGGKRAVTHLRPVEHIGDRYTVVECRLETGRTHQIRIHLAEIGHMLCGEKLYIRPRPGDAPVTDPGNAPRQALHSAEMRLIHPITMKPLSFRSELPDDLARWIAQLGTGA